MKRMNLVRFRHFSWVRRPSTDNRGCISFDVHYPFFPQGQIQEIHYAHRNWPLRGNDREGSKIRLLVCPRGNDMLFPHPFHDRRGE